jgi:hypothetical protein
MEGNGSVSVHGLVCLFIASLRLEILILLVVGEAWTGVASLVGPVVQGCR